MVIRIYLTMCILAASGCASNPAPAPVAGDNAPLPRGEALAMAVIGEWDGTAADGTEDDEDVELTLNADGRFTLGAGLVHESYHWAVRDDLIVLLPDLSTESSDGICFRASRISARRIEGKWTYTLPGARVDGDIGCRDAWYAVTLDRQQ